MSDIDQVLRAYGISEVNSAEKISGGKINSTWLIKENGQRYILQRIHSDFRPEMIDDCAYVLDRLRENGWDVSRILPTETDEFHHSLDGTWRLSTFIESDEQLPPLSTSLMYECGKLLARLHFSLSNIQRTVPAPLPHYRDTPFHIDYLKQVLTSLSGEAHSLAEKTIKAFDAQAPQGSSVAHQLIHGDPKINNILFRNKLPHTYIDWDALMTASPLVDLGDFVRSLTKEHSEENIDALIASFCQGYYDTNRLNFSTFDNFFAATLNAAKIIALENTARYLYDIVDQSFWEWDTSKYDSQEEAMLDQANKTWRIFESLDS
jgi:Ser/Thr protein kinase RdoA (MazF antagonist)